MTHTLSTDVLAARLVYDGTNVVTIPKECGEPRVTGDKPQMSGKVGENLCELAGRICYDSLGGEKTRGSAEYHKHILDVGHGSVYEHFNLTVGFNPEDAMTMPTAVMLLGRPGIHAYYGGPKQGWRVTLNARAVLEWNSWSERLPNHPFLRDTAEFVGEAIRHLFHEQMPLVIRKPLNPAVLPVTKLMAQNDDEKWVTLYLAGSRGFCYDDATEVLTDEGWKPWPEVRGDEQFCTLNAATDTVEYQAATHRTRERYIGAMYQVQSQAVDLLVTPNHRMYVRAHDTQAAKRGEEAWRIATATEVAGKRVHYRRGGVRWAGVPRSAFCIAARGYSCDGRDDSYERTMPGLDVDMRAFVEFLGYWLAEGHLDHAPGSGYSVVMTQNDDSPAFNRMVECVREMGFDPSIAPNGRSERSKRIRFTSHALYEYLKPLGLSADKYIPADILTLPGELLDVLIRAHHAGDGGTPARAWLGEANTVSRRLANDLQEAAMKAGYAATIRVVDRRHEPPRWNATAGVMFRHTKVGYVVGYVGPTRTAPLVNHNGKRHDGWTEYAGEIHCVTVPNGLLYVRRNGKPVWSGNSHEQVRHGDFSAISQRSTRYCQESESKWVEHPLITAYLADLDKRTLPVSDVDLNRASQEYRDIAILKKAKKVDPSIEVPEPSDLLKANMAAVLADVFRVDVDCVMSWANGAYDHGVENLEAWLKDKGVDAGTARKQARGASRGFLGNALSTEMLFSASVAQWLRMFKQRGGQAADAEIREVYVKALPELQRSRYGKSFLHLVLQDSPDGTGKCVVDMSAAK